MNQNSILLLMMLLFLLYRHIFTALFKFCYSSSAILVEKEGRGKIGTKYFDEPIRKVFLVAREIDFLELHFANFCCFRKRAANITGKLNNSDCQKTTASKDSKQREKKPEKKAAKT